MGCVSRLKFDSLHRTQWSITTKRLFLKCYNHYIKCGKVCTQCKFAHLFEKGPTLCGVPMSNFTLKRE